MYLKIAGRMSYLWRAVAAEGELLDALVQSRRNKPAALKLIRKLLKKFGFVPERMTIDNSRPTPSGSRTPASTGGRTIAPRIRTSRPSKRERDAALQEQDRLKDFSRPTPPSIMSLTSNAIFHRGQRTECSAPKRRR